MDTNLIRWALEDAKSILEQLDEGPAGTQGVIRGLEAALKSIREESDPITDLPDGSLLRCIKGFAHSECEGGVLSGVVRLTEGNIYVKDKSAGESIRIKNCDAGHSCWWPSPSENFEAV